MTSVATTRGGGRVGDNLSLLDQLSHLPHGVDQVCPYIGSDILVLWHVWESFKIGHSNDHISA